ncbi:SCO family protein [Ichthyenterobacterium sp. W332]|uniref:SCO family protein n=1 Tax=Microcosmobacter mediterraneus TaxID=3075607 RepID=A0ABU2YGZ7_9FLAO|nr:SCO family protein [Ichthyenterobacterium sp. W332]MDT0557307.1 SCO family protein [Ichthyenterobacterium sp. W332]
MKKLLKNRIVKVLILSLLVINVVSCKKSTKEDTNISENAEQIKYLPYYKDESFTPYWIKPNTDEERNFHKIPNFRLVNQLGDTITQKTFNDKIYITDFFFASCPGICPQMTGNMLKLQEKLINDNDILFLSHTVTPSRDSVSVLKNYAKMHGVIDNKWHLVTGDKEDIYNLGRHHYFVENDLGEKKDINDFLHTENFLLIDKNKHIRGIYNGLNRASLAQLIIDVEILQLEKN